jgi:hypothetical protein
MPMTAFGWNARGTCEAPKAKNVSDFEWLGSDSNRLPADYETAALTS